MKSKTRQIFDLRSLVLGLWSLVFEITETMLIKQLNLKPKT
jgi:hypothetical protein